MNSFSTLPTYKIHFVLKESHNEVMHEQYTPETDVKQTFPRARRVLAVKATNISGSEDITSFLNNYDSQNASIESQQNDDFGIDNSRSSNSGSSRNTNRRDSNRDNNRINRNRNRNDGEAVQPVRRNQNTRHNNMNLHNHNDDFENQDDKIDLNIDSSMLTLNISDLDCLSIAQLRSLAGKYSINLEDVLQRGHIINSLIKRVLSLNGGVVTFEGVLEISDNNTFGFLRSRRNNYVTSDNDIYVQSNILKKYNLETGFKIFCTIKSNNQKKNERFYPLDKILKINDMDMSDPENITKLKERCHFDDLIPCYPTEQYKIECSLKLNEQENIITRIVDLMSPIGKGQRALIVAPPRTGKTIFIKTITNALSTNYKDTKIFVLLIDERPEEVTDMRNSVNGEVISSTFDESPENHVHVAEMMIERAKRLVESGEDVIIIMESLTRLARAYNTVAPSSGKVLTGGVDSNALQKPKRLFGAARNIQGGGSLTIIATSLVETGSKMDEVIFEEFKGTGNCEIVLDRKIAERRIYPAFDIFKSGTRKEELLLTQVQLQKILLLRKALANMNVSEALELIRDKIAATKTNEDFLNSIASGTKK